MRELKGEKDGLKKTTWNYEAQARGEDGEARGKGPSPCGCCTQGFSEVLFPGHYGPRRDWGLRCRAVMTKATAECETQSQRKGLHVERKQHC